MVSGKRVQTLCGAFMVAILVVASMGCGGSSNNNLSQAQVQAISHELATSVETAVQTAIPAGSEAGRSARPSLANVVKDLEPQQLSGCTTSGGTTTCDVQVSYSGPCPDGGTIAVAGNFDFTLNSSGSGSSGESLTVTPTNCGVEYNLTINGNPSVGLSTTITVADDNIVYPLTLVETGGITYGPNPSGSCSLDVTYTVAPQGSQISCTVSGTMCGQTLSGSC